MIRKADGSDHSGSILKPLGKLSLGTKEIQEGNLDTPEKRLRYLKAIKTRTGNLVSLVDSLSEYSRLDSGFRYHMGETDFKDYVEKYLELVRPDMENPNLVFSKDTLFDRVRGMDSMGDAATVTVHINRLRDKLGKNDSKDQFKRKGETVKKKLLTGLILSLAIPGLLSGCGKNSDGRMESMEQMEESQVIRAQEDAAEEESNGKEARDENVIRINPIEEITELETGLSAVQYEGDYGFDTFLEQGGADTDAGVAAWLASLLEQELSFSGTSFGCSTLSVENRDGGYLFGRNFDWNTCNGLIVSAKPENGFASVSTVNLDFIRAGGMDISKLPDRMQALVSLYAPLDGLNEKGLAVSVNMIQDQAAIRQNTGKPDITTTTAVRLLLDQAEDVEEALNLLEQYDFHSSMGMMVHLALADAGGRSVAVEYVDNEMIITETPVVTNFYLAEGEKQGIGTAQSHTRYEILMQALEEHGEMTETEVRDALDSVSKDNFGEFESTEWSIVMNQETKELIYYHREDYEKEYLISVEQGNPQATIYSAVAQRFQTACARISAQNNFWPCPWDRNCSDHARYWCGHMRN